MKTPLLLTAVCLASSAFAAGPLVPPPPKAPDTLPVPAIVSETIPEWQARWELARVLAHAQRYDESLAEYQKVLAAKPDLAEARAEYGQILGWSGRNDDSIRELSAVSAKDLSPSAAVLLADLLLGQKRFEQSASLYRSALAKAPDDTTRFKLARVLSFLKDYEGSLAEFETLLKAHPDDVQIRRHYAQVLGWAGRNDDSAAQWRRSLNP